MSTIYFSCDDRRRDIIAGRADLNGIDFIEVYDLPTLPIDERQLTLFVHFINDPGTLTLGPGNVIIEGGERVRNIRVMKARVKVDSRIDDTTRAVLVVETDQRGDFSTYTLRLVEDPTAPAALTAIDPVLRAIDFSFKVNCPSDFDCVQCQPCPPERDPEPAIDYLARDFNSLRQLLLDRLAVLAPQWQDRGLADLGVTLVELLAYVGDQLSYRQDAVATEAYLGTARRRISARRHARLADYSMHDGNNARVWLRAEIDPAVSGSVTLPAHTKVLSAVADQGPLIAPGSSAYRLAVDSGAVVFETMHEATFWADHNDLHFYTWGGRESCLPKGAVRATLRRALPHLKPGDFLLFFEARNPRSGDPADASLERRHVVKLVEVTPRTDPIGGQFDDPPTDTPVDVTDIRWAAEDALPFPLCISSEADEEFGAGFVGKVSVAWGNLVLADHGLTLSPERLPVVPRPVLSRLASTSGEPQRAGDEEDCCSQARQSLEFVPVRYGPTLKESPLTQAADFTALADFGSAHAAFEWDPQQVRPAIFLDGHIPQSIDVPQRWEPVRDLLEVGGETPNFVVEIDNDAQASLRFGDGEHGLAVTPGLEFAATYRIGNGGRGNVGAESLAHLVSDDSRILRITNPMAARGGRDPETIEEVRQAAPFAFVEKQERCVTPDDYAARAAQYAGVQRAAGTMRWTGSWHTMFVSVDRLGGATLDPDFERNLRSHLEPLRMAGIDLEVEPPQPVALDLVLRIQAKPDYFASDVQKALLEIFTSGYQPDGRPGLFHPDNFSFGQTVYLSPWIAAAQAIPGVASVEVETFERRDAPGPAGPDQGFITVSRLEVPVLENNRNFPERGTFDPKVEGGR